MSDFLARLIGLQEDVSGNVLPTGRQGAFDELDMDMGQDLHSARAHEVEEIRASGLFDGVFYLETYRDVLEAGVDPVEHFVDNGWKEDKRPNFYFEPNWYLNANPDVINSGHNPLFHYALYGDKEGRNPGPLFSNLWYRNENKLGSDESALGHYLSRRKSGAVSPFPDFDIVHYAKNNSDVIAAGVDPFEHFVSYGYKEWRNPSEELDLYFYVRRYLKNNSRQHPFFHYLQNKHKPGVYGRMPDDEVSIPREIKRFTKPSAYFEELKPVPASAPRLAKVLAYYLPQFHSFAENDAWWGQGFTEWTNIPRGVPRFAGHYQPRVPRDLGYYNLDSMELMRRQIDMAKGNGISGFVFYHYWFNGKRLMDKPVESFLNDASLDMPFSLMWANENWTRRWDGSENELLISQDYRPDDDALMVADFVRHFKDPRYIRLQGRPLLMIYRPGVIPNCAKTIAGWRKIFRDAYAEDPVIFMVQAFGDTDPREFGFDGAVEFPPHKLTQTMPPANHDFELLDLEFTGKIYHYDAVVAQSLEEAPPPYPLIKTAVPSWDNDARRQGAGLVIAGSTPEKYESWLSQLVERAQQNPCLGEPLVCVNAWNEWCEGAYLEPDLHFGAAFLNATGRAICGISSRSKNVPKLLLVGHDAFASGAQHLLLNIGRRLIEMYGIQIEFLLLEGGQLEKDYQGVGQTYVKTSKAALLKQLNRYKESGYTTAIVNTLASASIVSDLVSVGIEPVLLVHELPRLLKERSLLDLAKTALRDARSVVFPADYVRDAVMDAAGVTRCDNVIVQPQGSYKEVEPNQDLALRFRQQLSIPEDEPVVLGIGYADLRKGFDIFLQIWRYLNHKSPVAVHVCWVGGIDPELAGWLSGELDIAKGSRTFHMLGYMDDVTPALSAANVFALTSREDPFPTVVLEAVAAGLPVVAFERSGGIPEVITAHQFGHVVAHCDAIGMADAIRTLIDAGNPVFERERRQQIIKETFSFSRYVERLRDIALPGPPMVSVAVPNYNYARYMPERLGSIFRQTYPVAETIVLDDKSSDDSLLVIPRIATEWNRDIKIVPNKVNSGSVFAQWRKAAELATSDWLWIGEADDSAHPEFLESVMAAIGSDESIVMAFCDSRSINIDGSPLWASYKGYYDTFEPAALTESAVYQGHEFIRRFLTVKNAILNVSSVVWNRKALLRVLDACGPGLHDLKLAGDWLLYLKILSEPGARIAYHAGSLNIHRRHADSVTHILDAEQHIAEIEKCQIFARSISPDDQKLSQNQAIYLHEVAGNLGIELPFRPFDSKTNVKLAALTAAPAKKRKQDKAA